ncbi:MAG: hypothetical protein EPN93_14210 [Spirochaetes bacterium]|nr:MAG: hypothetical protein EPN93_14210 [Spirochaetota bacterium]
MSQVIPFPARSQFLWRPSPGLGLYHLGAIAEKLRTLVESERIDYGGEEVRVTITFGVTGYDPALSVDANIRRADNALYRGKRGSKNCVCLEK